jgi:hypothetical protein
MTQLSVIILLRTVEKQWERDELKIYGHGLRA